MAKMSVVQSHKKTISTGIDCKFDYVACISGLQLQYITIRF